MKRLGIDIGSLYAGCVIIEDGKITARKYTEHKGDIGKFLHSLADDPDFQSFETCGLTGNIRIDGYKTIDTVLGLVEGARFLAPESRNVFAVGGETFTLIIFDEEGGYREHTINPPCASGTGSFIEQQAERLDLTAAELSEKAAAFTGKYPLIATRCAVFAKTDIIHAMQEGYSIDAISAGLCEGIGRSIIDNLVKGKELSAPIALIGGLALNKKITETIEKVLSIRIVIPPHAEIAGAVGAALIGEEKSFVPMDALVSGTDGRKTREKLDPHVPGYPDFDEFEIRKEDGVEVMMPKQAVSVDSGILLGIDIGSTSTKAAVLSVEGEIAAGFYTATGGAPIDAVKKLLETIQNAFPGKTLTIRGTATTGSGRNLIKELFRADFAVNEITAHAKAASFLDPQTDTIIEIGGQDSKFTKLHNGEVYFSTMNYVCAAGTGSFIEEQAKRLTLSLSDFSGMAFQAQAPYTSDRCTVYMERDLSALLAEGWSREALTASVLNSVRDNYLAKVVNKTPMGDHIVFQGATARNKALVASFRQALQKPVYVSPYCHLTGAIGAALLCPADENSDSAFSWNLSEADITEEICDRCVNHCLLTVVDRSGVKTGWGMKCGKEYDERSPRKKEAGIFEKRFQEVMKPLEIEPDTPQRDKLIGIPNVLYNAGYAPLWHNFFRRLGFPTIEVKAKTKAGSRGKGIVNADFCSPIINAHGQFRLLIEEGADFIFYPSILNETNPDQEEHRFKKKTTDSYFCYYSQYLPSITSKLTSLDLEDRLISPLLSFNSQSINEIADTISSELHLYFPDLDETQIREAFPDAYRQFTEARQKWSVIFPKKPETVRKDPLRIAVLGRPYVALDPEINLRIPEKLEELGAEVFWQDEIDLSDFEPKYGARYYERMHWHYGKQILKLAEYAAGEENLFIVYLTCFRCSPDSFLLSYVKDIMNHYGKPFLVLQLDEHSSDVGYTTRIEAGLTSFRNYLHGIEKKKSTETRIPPRDDQLEEGDTVLVPGLDSVISTFWAACFEKAGYRAVVLDAGESALSTGYQHVNGGECMPLVSIIGSAIETVKRYELPAAKTFFYMPTVCMACNFPQFPVLADLAFSNADLGGMKIGLINNMAPGEILPQSLSIRMLESNIVGGILYKMMYRIMPYETEPGNTKRVFLESTERIRRAILDGTDLKTELSEIVGAFTCIPRDESGGRKPRIGLLGDLYVKFNDIINQRIQETVNDLGGELIVPSLTEYPFHFYDADIRLFGDNPRHFRLLRTIEQRYEKMAAELIGDQMEPDFAECVELLDEYKLKHYIAGETSMNVGRALYYIKNAKVDAILHINPMFCCPGVVSSSIYRKMQDDFGVPIIDIFYDGTGNPNKVLIPHLHYLADR